MDVAASYDALPYPSSARPAAHPDRLATIAALRGLAAPAVERCRVLEIGCASGEHLIALGVALPGAELTGIDLSERQIETGRRRVEALGLRNVRLERADVAAVGAARGEYDYVIAHGVLSWVPEAVQEAILEVAGRRLAPGGVAYLSYNTYPGWRVRRLLGDLLRWRARGAAAPAERVAAAREAIAAIAATDAGGRLEAGPLVNGRSFSNSTMNERSFSANEDLAGRLLREEASLAAARPDAYLAHEHLDASPCSPLLFHELAERAARHGLAVLGDADPAAYSLLERVPPATARAVLALARDPIGREQVLDFFLVRPFRSTLLCRAGHALDAEPRPERLRGLLAAAADIPALGPGVAPRAGAVFDRLARSFPRPVPVADLLPRDPDGAARMLALLRHAFVHELLELHVHAPPIADAPGARPVASPLARLDAAAGATTLVNLRLEEVALDDDAEALALVPRLDGTRDRGALGCGSATEGSLERLRRHALLVAEARP